MKPEMTPEQESHLEAIKGEFVTRLDQRYRDGQLRHGGNVWDRDVLEDAIEEAIDLVVYLLTLKQKNGHQ